MSLILEALKKLDRDKQAPERGFLVVASPAWPARTRRPLLALAAIAATLVGVGAAVMVARRPRGPVASSSVPLPRSVATPAAAVAPESAPSARPVPLAPASLPTASPRRPTAASAAPLAATPPPLVLQAISSRDGRPIALVSDRLVREGDEFDGVTVVRIGDAEVEVEWKGQRSIIRF